MKIQTKEKIIRWVKKILNYDETKLQPRFTVEQRKIQLIQLDNILSKEEKRLLDNVNGNFQQILEDNISVKIAQAMLKMGAIKIEYSFKEDGSVRVNAKTYVPEKL
jgi:hypothetical protein